MTDSSAELSDFEHPLQKHPLNFTNIKQGSAFYSLTETQSLDFLLDVNPTPPSGHSHSVSVVEKDEEASTQDIASDKPASEPPETTCFPTSVAQVNESIAFEDPLQLDASLSQPSNGSDEAQKHLVEDADWILKSLQNEKDQAPQWITDIQLKLQSEKKHSFIVCFSLLEKDRNTEEVQNGMDDRKETFDSTLESNARREETEDGFIVVSVERSKMDFTALDSMLRTKYRFCIFPALPLESLKEKFRYRSDSINHLRKDYERYLGRISKHPKLGHSDEFLAFLGVCKGDKSWSERSNEFLRDDLNSKGDMKHRVGKNLAQWARLQASEATKELRKGLSLIFEGHHTKEVDTQESVLARMEKIDRYLKSLENGLVSANKALEQYVERRSSLSNLVKSLESCFHERSNQEGSKMGEIFSSVAQSFAKDVYPKSQGEEMLVFVLRDYSFLARDARRILGERLHAYESYEEALSKYNEHVRKLEITSQTSSSAHKDTEKSATTSSAISYEEELLDRCRRFYEQAAYTTDSELRRFRLEYHLEMNRALYRLAYERWKGHLDSGKSWEQVFRLCDKQYNFLQQQISQG
ncbi:hypothetical protein GpartN1_g2057.t1 [Galdieria partita]|uniref:PX domain-containing protein n=1 Tax=Galdieria partita TaxID=83374 RepID=A0A9C7PTN4_9RHOD|nr:hypothetical protein GpartN1_g2057.t1 [Galdieria partita]